MPDGFHGSKEEWEKLEAPLVEIDELLQNFARENNMKLVKNYHNWPCRHLRWIKDIPKLIEIALEDKELMTFRVWICTFHDIEQKRFWKHSTLKSNVSFPEIRDNLAEILADSKKMLESWSAKGLKFAGEINK
ncbi:MAG TPA: hypothetical protein ENG95_00505 [Nitrospirae bacterium]|nr:hypothetical protein BMS3Bbin08_01934 [bacterium BMS3Bbin08]HDO25106.1 hypothetical protein [Nitrospirota bacterium]